MTLITHLRQENNIHELVFVEASRKATDQFIEILTKFYTEQEDTVYILLDLRQSGMLPLRYLTVELRRLNHSYANHAPVFIALVLADATIIEVTSALMRTIMRRDSAQYFMDIEKARFWLTLEQSKQHSLGN